MKSKLLILLAVLLLVVSTVFVSASATTETTDPEMSFSGSTVLLENSVVLRYYTTLENVSDPYDVSILVWSSAQESYTKGSQQWTVPYEGVTKVISGVTYYCFDFEGVNAKMLADDFYAVVYTSNGDGEFYSKPCKYSILQYAYYHLGRLGAEASTDTALIKLLEDMLDYGASAQDYFNYNENRLANADFYQIKLSGGTLDDGFTSGLYTAGATPVAAAPASRDGVDFSYWQDSLGNIVSYDASYTITVGTANASYTAVYGATVEVENPALTMPYFDPSSVPAYSQSTQVGYVELNGNVPFFTQNQIVSESYEYYSPLDSLRRCGIAVASLGVDLMPTEERGDISSIKPTGWHSTASDSTIADIVPGGSLYNRSHLIAFSLAGENANELNLITGTQSFNQVYMQIYENLVLDFLKEYKANGEDRHIMYRVTPIFEGNNLVASGVIMEGWSVEDNGEDVCFNVYVYNNQPGITIDYATGDYSIYDSSTDGGDSGDSGSGDSGTGDSGSTDTTEQAYYMTVTLDEITYYFTGSISNGVGSSTTDKASALKMYIVQTSGGYYIYSKDSSGNKTYYGTGDESTSLTSSSSPILMTMNSTGNYIGSGDRTFSYYQNNNGTVTFRTYASSLRPAEFIKAE